MSAATFLHHRQSALYHFKLADGHDADAAAARHHLRSALSLAAEVLAAVVADTPAERTQEATRLTSLWPLVATASALAKCLAALNAKTDVLFDPELAYWEQQLAAAIEIFSVASPTGESSVGSTDKAVPPDSNSSELSSPLFQTETINVCAACGSKHELEADVDSPGIFYCVPCWVAYDNGDFDSSGGAADATAEAMATLDNAVGDARARGIIAYSISEMLALQTAHSAPLDADPVCLLGHSNVASVTDMLASLPQPRLEKSSGAKSGSKGGGGISNGAQRKRNAQKKEGEERQVKPKEDSCGPDAGAGACLPSESSMAEQVSHDNGDPVDPTVPLSDATSVVVHSASDL